MCSAEGYLRSTLRSIDNLTYEDVKEAWLKDGSRRKTALKKAPETPPRPVSSHISLKVETVDFSNLVKRIDRIISPASLDFCYDPAIYIFCHILKEQYSNCHRSSKP